MKKAHLNFNKGLLYFSAPLITVLIVNLSFVLLIYIFRDIFSGSNNDLSQILTTAFFLLFLSILILVAISYQRSSPKPHYDAFMVSIIVPIYNEENLIYRVLEQIISSDYPIDKMEIIAINDGSSDNTLSELLRFKNEKYPNLSIINFHQNMGKKEGLIGGFEASRGDIIITIDSDTFLEKNSISEILKYFHEDVAAVAGYTEVFNAKNNLLTRIQYYEYFISHHLYKAFEAKFGSVLCCPGCFSAYRRQVVLDVLPEFKNSMVYGFPIDYGEDRFLTALIIRNSGKINFAQSAKASTVVPESLKGFIGQRIRWIKSWFVNSIYLVKRVTQLPIIFSTYYFFSFVFNLLIVSLPFIIIGQLIIGELLFLINTSYIILFYVVFYLWKIKKFDLFLPILFFLFTVIIYSWLIPWSLAKVKDKGWGNRVIHSID